MVWLQSNKFNIPRLAFVNKMDRPGASLEQTIESIKERLNVKPLVLQIPIGDDEDFNGVIDLISMTKYIWKDKLGDIVDIEEVNENHTDFKQANKYREQLIDTISLLDDQIAD